MAPALRGIATLDAPETWDIERYVAELAPLVDRDTVLWGQDFGGVVAATLASRVPVRRLVLTGTALGPYWAAVRLTTLPGLRRYFFHTWAGRRFLAGAVVHSPPEEVLRVFDPARIPDLGRRMEAMARVLRPAPDLARRLRGVEVRLVWGRRDAWYPPPVARAVARGVAAPITWIDAGHLAMWERPEACLRAATDGLSG